MARAIMLAYGIVAYAVFFATFLYLIGFVGALPFIPLTIDRGGPSVAPAMAALIDVALIALFGIQHSIMARQGFKAAWTRIVPKPIERSTYLLFSSAALIVLYLCWHPITTPVWSVSDPLAAGIVWTVFGIGWATVLLSTFLINHFELFGLQQVWAALRGNAIAGPVFRQPLLYKLVRHPLYTGFVLAFWSIPVMTVGHLLFAVGMTAYIVVAIGYEERDLVGLFGEAYVDYKQKVGMLFPRIGK